MLIAKAIQPGPVMGSVMALRSKETVRCVSELSSDEPLREVPLLRSRHSANAKAAKRKENMYLSSIFWGFD